MTEEQRGSLYRKLIVIFIILGAGTWAWVYPYSVDGWLSKFKLMLKFNPEPEAPAKMAARPENYLTIIHFHLPGEAASEQVAEVLNQVGKKYGNYVEVNRAGFEVQPADWMERAKIKLPYVLMIHDGKIAFQYQGMWSKANVVKKVDEILFSIRTMDKDWRPKVPGMIPKGG